MGGSGANGLKNNRTDDITNIQEGLNVKLIIIRLIVLTGKEINTFYHYQ